MVEKDEITLTGSVSYVHVVAITMLLHTELLVNSESVTLQRHKKYLKFYLK